MMIFKMAIPRRTFLRGLGATIALPLLDGMIPALTAASETAAKPVLRISYVYVPNGIVMEKWTPKSDGTGFELTPILEPLARFRDDLTVISGLSNSKAFATTAPGPDHPQAATNFMTGIGGVRGELRAGISVDQIIAKEFAKETQLASLELGLDPADLLGRCDRGEFSCAYKDTMSWRGPTTPLPMECNPRVVFERIFGDTESTSAADRRARMKETRSILDSLAEDSSRLRRKVGRADAAKITEYLESIRDIERRIQLAEEQSSKELPLLDRPAGAPPTFAEHAKMMFDLQLLAFQTDMTRAITFMVAHEEGGRAYPEIGIHEAHHPLTHHGGDPEKIAQVAQINTYHTQNFAYFLDRLKSIPDGDGSLLDHVIILYGGGLSDGNEHAHTNLPILLLGGKTAGIRGGRHLRYPKEKNIPTSNLHLALLDKLGIHLEKFGDSSGELELLNVS
jgi:uncharacterized protein DUF1552